MKSIATRGQFMGALHVDGFPFMDRLREFRQRAIQQERARIAEEHAKRLGIEYRDGVAVSAGSQGDR